MKKGLFILFIVMGALLAACSDTNNAADSNEEVKLLQVDFPLKETATAGESIELKAIVTYGEEKETKADEVKFEYWKKDDKDNSTMIEAENNGDGTYTAEVTFDEEATYEIYAHVSADDLHTMPLKSITITK